MRLVAAALLALALTSTAAHARVPVNSTHGSGIFGTWGVDARGLPRYDYKLDQRTAPQAAQSELAGKREAWHQLGNDHIVANAYNRGFVQLWSQDRVYHWVNLDEPDSQRWAGGHGYLRVDGKTVTTLYDDLDASVGATRRFGSGYFERATPVRPISIKERVYAPFGDDPILLHDVLLKNHSDKPVTATWFEYWGVNPVQQLPANRINRGLEAPVANDGILTAHMVDPQDADPLHIYAAAIDAPVAGFETRADSFFGAGGRKAPDAVGADKLEDGIAAPVPFKVGGKTIFALRSPVTVPAGKTLTLRYAYGAAHDPAALVAKYRATTDPFKASQKSWRDWLPQVRFGAGRDWISRELQWDAYTLRSGTTYEEACGHHIISQGGFYQYSLGFQGAYRDPLQHMLPMIHLEPEIAREVLRYSARVQPKVLRQIPYAMLGQCTRFDFGTSNDLDLWLLLAAAEYGLAARDMAFFDERIPWSDGGDATIWEHLKSSFAYQESQRGPHGGYITGATGDWSDFSTQFLGMTESLLVTAQAAFIYPRLAELAQARGDAAFAAQLRTAGAQARDTMRTHWVGKGWYARAYSGGQRLGEGAVYGEPQPWALLAGIPSAQQAVTLVANIRRFLTGVGAPAQVKGPAKIGSAQSPARNDPEVTETTLYPGVTGSNTAVYVGFAWYAINGWLTWSLASLDGVVPQAREYAFDEFLRNTLAAHADAYPEHWNGIVSVDDACHAHYDAAPDACGVGLSTVHNGQIMHQPAWSLWDAIKLAGVEPTAGGYRIAPHLPLSRFRLSTPAVGVARERGRLRGHVRLERDVALAMEVKLPAGMRLRSLRVDGKKVASTSTNGFVRFTLPLRSGRAARWILAYRKST